MNKKETFKKEALQEIREQIQEDIITYCDGMGHEFKSALCQIVVDNFQKLKRFAH
jgi:hypothetical protein